MQNQVLEFIALWSKSCDPKHGASLKDFEYFTKHICPDLFLSVYSN